MFTVLSGAVFSSQIILVCVGCFHHDFSSFQLPLPWPRPALPPRELNFAAPLARRGPPTLLQVGASGAIMGLLGGWTAQLLCQWGDGDAAQQGQRMTQFVVPPPAPPLRFYHPFSS